MNEADANLFVSDSSGSPFLGPTARGGVCDTDSGPCACGAWHGEEPKIPTAKELADALEECQEELAAVTRDRDAYATEALIALAGCRICTPEKGYVKDGGPGQLVRDIKDLARERDEARSQLLHATERYESAQKVSDEILKVNEGLRKELAEAKSLAEVDRQIADNARAELSRLKAAGCPRCKGSIDPPETSEVERLRSALTSIIALESQYTFTTLSRSTAEEALTASIRQQNAGLEKY